MRENDTDSLSGEEMHAMNYYSLLQLEQLI